MQLIFANPAGWWGLLMLPALVLIHCLHVNRRPQIISTLFLVRAHSSERRGGRTFVFWKHSVTFWLQVLAALLLTWLLLQPRWIGAETRQRIAIVLDSSLSMDAYRDAMLAALRSETQTLNRSAAQTHWLLTGSEPRPQVLYSGDSREALLHAAEQWRPRYGTHDTSPAIRSAHALGGGGATVIFLTDHVPQSPPPQTRILSVGTPLPNAGFTGLHTETREGQTIWRTLIKNHSDQPIQRQWWIETDAQTLSPRQIQIPANGSLALSGAIPEGVRAMTLVLEDDPWPLDNRLPLVLPEPKPLSYRIDAAEQTATLEKLLQSLPNTARAGNDAQPDNTTQADSTAQPDLIIAEFPRSQIAIPAANPATAITTSETTPSAETQQENLPTAQSTAIDLPPSTAASRILFAPAGGARTQPAGPLSATSHALNEGLNWNSLALQGEVRAHTLTASQTPLVWLGNVPLIWINEREGGRDLVFNFSPAASNALKLPATVLLISRFAEQVRNAKPAYQALNTELGQQLRISIPSGAKDVRLDGEPVLTGGGQLIMQAPERPGFFSVSADGKPLLSAAAHFADLREADLRHAASYSDTAALKRELIEANSEADALHSLWLLLLAATLLASWRYAERGR